MAVFPVSIPIRSPFRLTHSTRCQEFHRIDFLFSGHVKVGAFQHGIQRKVGAEADVLAEGRDDFSTAATNLFPLLK